MIPSENEFDTPSLEGIMLNEINHTEKDKYHMISLARGIFKKINTNEQTKQKLIETKKKTDPCQRGVGWTDG